MKKALLVLSGLLGLLLVLFGIILVAIDTVTAFSSTCVLVGGIVSFYSAEYINKLDDEQTKAAFLSKLNNQRTTARL